MNQSLNVMNEEKVPFLLQLNSSETAVDTNQDTLTIHESLPWSVSQNIEHATLIDLTGRTDVEQETTDDE